MWVMARVSQTLPVVDVKKRLVAHEESAHELQGGNLQGEVKRGDQAYSAEGPPVAIALLPCMVS